MHRREFITLLGTSAAAWPLAARAQQGAIRRIGILLPGVPNNAAGFLPTFRQALGALGHVEGRSYVLDIRAAEEQLDRLPALAAELVERKVDVIVAPSAVATLAASRATTTIPIVQAGGGDPVRSSGTADSLARPGGNVTGLTHQSEDLSGKLLELLLKMVPTVSRVGVLFVPDAPVTPLQLRQIQDAGPASRVAIVPVGVSGAAALDSAFATLARENVGGLVVLSAAAFGGSVGRRIIELAAVARLPTIYPYRISVANGGLISYGVKANESFRHAARLVDRILKGARTADLPIEQPTRFELVINLKTARALGLDIPDKLLALADEVIE
jgi:putative ABC transport system substrate-binding protein